MPHWCHSSWPTCMHQITVMVIATVVCIITWSMNQLANLSLTWRFSYFFFVIYYIRHWLYWLVVRYYWIMIIDIDITIRWIWVLCHDRLRYGKRHSLYHTTCREAVTYCPCLSLSALYRLLGSCTDVQLNRFWLARGKPSTDHYLTTNMQQ